MNIWTILFIVWLVGFVALAAAFVGLTITDRDDFERGLTEPIIVAIAVAALWPVALLACVVGSLSERRRAKSQVSAIPNAAGLESASTLTKP
jgi:hypothetical protein